MSALTAEVADATSPVADASSLIAASYYPDWAADQISPENLDYSKFDLIFFGETLWFLYVFMTVAVT